MPEAHASGLRQLSDAGLAIQRRHHAHLGLAIDVVVLEQAEDHRWLALRWWSQWTSFN